MKDFGPDEEATSTDSSILGIFSLFDSARNLTISVKSEESEQWMLRLGLCFVAFLSVGESAAQKGASTDILNTALYSRYVELQAAMWWAANAIFSGVYDSAVRDMRYVLESMIEACYIDKSNIGKPFSDRLVALRKNKLTGRRLIRKCMLPEEIEKAAIELYGQLSGFVHPGDGALKPSGHFTDLSRFFRNNLYAECRVYYDCVQDLVLALLFNEYQAAGATFLQKGTVEQKLESLKYRHTLSICGGQKPG